MYFPFLTCEVKCGDIGLTIADRQNMHNASVSVKDLVELFKRIGWQGKLDRKVLAFSISHNYDAVQIYGHFASIDGNEARVYRHEIAKFFFDAAGGKDKWTAYKFTKNVYDVFVPLHLARIRAAVDQLPNPEVFSIEPLTDKSSVDFFRQDSSQAALLQSEDGPSRLPSSQTSNSMFKK